MASRFVTLSTAGLVLFWMASVLLSQERDTPASVPPEARQKEIRAQLDDALGVSKARTTTQKQEATRGLMEMALDPGVSPEELYVVLRAALSLVQETGDFETHELAASKLTETFSADPEKDRVDLLLVFISSGKSSSSIKPAVELLATLAQERGFSNQFDEPIQWLVTADRAAKKIRAKASIDLIAATKLNLTDRKTAFESQIRAQEVLKADSENASANQSVGLWLAVFEGDWVAALPHLSKAGDSKWRAAAQAELTASADAESQLKVADAWYDVSLPAGPAQMPVRQRAFDAYASLESNLTSPISKTRVAKRKAELATALKDYTPISKPVQPKPVEIEKLAVELPVGESIEMQEWVKLPDHVISGTWKRDQDNGIACDNAGFSRFFVPVSIAGSYQLNMRFVRPRKDPNTVAILMRSRIGCARPASMPGTESCPEFSSSTELRSLRESPEPLNSRSRLKAALSTSFR